MTIEKVDDPHETEAPSSWVCRWQAMIPSGGRVLDVAAGGGRHARYLAGCGHPVEAVDRDAGALQALHGTPGVSVKCFDLESGAWPYAPRLFAGIVVTNYLHRPLFHHLIEALAPGGVLIYDTFATGNDKYGRPSRPEFLLRPGELLEIVRGRLKVVAYENLFVSEPRPAMKQRLCAVKPEN